MCVADNTHDLAHRLRVKVGCQCLPYQDVLTHRIFVRPVFVCQCLIDERYSGCGGSIIFGDVASPQDGNLEEIQVTRGNAHPSARGNSLC
jgi:hypothetical protein